MGRFDPEEVAEFLNKQREDAPEELQQTFLDIEDNWERKLWHQLTGILDQYFSNPASAHQRLPLFEGFILSFWNKINQLKFVSLALQAATQCSGMHCLILCVIGLADSLLDDHARLKFLTQLTEKVDRPVSQDAYVYSLAAVAEVKLRLDNYEGARKDLDKAESILDTFNSVETEVHATFYRTNASYYQVCTLTALHA